jgi:hypothetical protein
MGILLGYSNLIDDSTLSGSFDALYPIENIQTRELHRMARSTGTSASVTVTLPSSQPIGVVGVVGNLSSAATISVAAGAYSSGSVNAVAVSPGVSASSVTVSISDPGNADGYVGIGRIFVGPAFNPAVCMDWGVQWGLDSLTEVAVSMGGAEYFNERRTRRTWQGKWSWLTAAEAYDVLYAIMRSHGISKEVFLLDTTEPTREKAFLARFKQLSAIEWPYVDQHSCGIELSELL